MVVNAVDEVVNDMSPEADASAQTVLAYVKPETSRASKDGEVCSAKNKAMPGGVECRGHCAMNETCHPET